MLPQQRLSPPPAHAHAHARAGLRAEAESPPAQPPPAEPPAASPAELLSQAGRSLAGIYSTSGFDVLACLSKVVHRRNPKFDIGPVDLTCSFLVSDLTKPDIPVIYASPTFEKLTGYTSAEIVGKNCRFLQGPDGNVKKGEPRLYTENKVIYQMKQLVERREEGQFCLINYKKGGEPFINLITCIPITWEDPNKFTLMVGLQIDLVQQPQTILESMKAGQYLTYQTGPALKPWAPGPDANTVLAFQEDVQECLEPLLSPSSSARSIGDETVSSRSLIEASEDFIHILSMRGLFLYAAPNSCKKLLEFDAADLVSMNIADLVHPADNTALQREFRNAQAGDPINLCYRFKRKYSGWIYLEVVGHVYNTKAKRNRCFLFTAREKPVGCLMQQLLMEPVASSPAPGGLDVYDCWLKVSAEGLILHASAPSADVFGLPAENLIAHSVFNFLNTDDRAAAKSCLDAIVSGNLLFSDCGCRIIRNYLLVPGFLRFLSDSVFLDRRQRTIILQVRAVKAPGMTPDAAAQQTMQLAVNASSEQRAWSMTTDVDIYEIMNPVRATNVQFEINNLKALNKRIADELVQLGCDPGVHRGGGAGGDAAPPVLHPTHPTPATTSMPPIRQYQQQQPLQPPQQPQQQQQHAAASSYNIPASTHAAASMMRPFIYDPK